MVVLVRELFAAARWRSGNAGVCKTSIRRFKSGTRLKESKSQKSKGKSDFDMEYDKIDYTDVTYESGYSEEQLALDTEIQSGGWRNLRKFRPYQDSSRQQKIFFIYQAVSSNLSQVIAMHITLEGDQREESLTELKKLRMIQDILLNCLLWEQEGELERGMIPEEVWELIE